MAGGSAAGRLVVLDRAGRAGKAFPLPAGAATLGRAPACDVRVLLPSVAPLHATLVVHRNQVLIRNVGEGETLVNDCAVSVCALQHGDVITVGGRSLRWEYDNPHLIRPLPTMPALYKGGRGGRGGRGGVTSARRVTTAAPTHPARSIQPLHHRASMPGNAGGKQVAIVQPQRRDTSDQTDTSPRSPRARRPPATPPAAPSPPAPEPRSFAECPPDTTKATLWIESRKSSPRKSAMPPTPPPVDGARAMSLPGRRATPLRVAVLRRARSARRRTVAKIQAPRELDPTKQAALMLMTGHTPRKPSPSTTIVAAPASLSPALLVKKHSPLNKRQSRKSRKSKRKSSRGSAGESVSVVSIADTSSAAESASGGELSALSDVTAVTSPRKSALRDPTAARASRKNESIKFDLSNLEPRRQDTTASRTTRRSALSDAATDDDVTLHYDTSDARTPSPAPAPSPRRPIHARASTMLELSGSPLRRPQHGSPNPTVEPTSPSRSARGGVMVRRALENTFNDTSKRSRRAGESYSIVDLVSSRESLDDSTTSVYASAGSTRTSSIVFGSPRSALSRACSTPYVGRRSRSNADKTLSDTFVRSSTASRRSKSLTSLTTPENSEETQKHISINSTRISRANKSRSRLDDGDSHLISIADGEESPRTSRRNTTANLSHAISVLSPKKSSPSLLAKTSSPIASPKRTSLRASGLERSPRTSRSSQGTPNRSSPISSPKRVTSQTSSPKRASSRSSRSIGPTLPSSSTVSPRTPTLSPKRTSRSQQGTPKTSSPTASPKSPTFSPEKASRSQRGTPKTASPKRATPQSSSPKTSPRNKNSRSNLTSDTTYVSSGNEGTITPENTTAPQEQGTPVLSIQYLLDSSQSSFASQKSPTSKNIKRKTIGTLRSNKKGRRSSPKSKSFTASARRSLRSLRLNSKESDTANASSVTGDSDVTPRSGARLVAEPVKNKHSTAKKPQSKRSLIDNLNDSDIVKQLFNSPVKRKLSQSMTEFSRKKLFDDDDEGVKRRPARNTVAGMRRTPDTSSLDHTDRYTPENFVSPLNTPSDSPNSTGIERRNTRKSPRNDLSDVRGVKSLLRSPRTRRSVRNDLTDVSGVKRVFAKSPRNRLTDVRVKEVFVASPKNDLRRVSGVKSLFRAQKEKASPKNDLSDVRGVKRLLTRKSAANDLSNVSGVKKALAKSPKNDLRDVRGVKLLFRQNKSRKDESLDLSGVEELFDVSNVSSTSHKDLEALFDQLIGKPPIKAVYSKSFLTKRPQKGKRSRQAKSLHTSIDLITNNVEQWLEQELQKRVHKERSASKVSRALQQLATDTVEGSEPIRTSRVRNSTLDVTGRKKSASEIYDAHTLPIKKRSIVERSLQKKKSFVEASLEKSKSIMSSSRILPIKKRVVHSTPVKGARHDLTMNASELGRVSPIPAPRRKPAPASPRGKGKPDSKVNVLAIPEQITIEIPPMSPKSPSKRTSKSNTDQTGNLTGETKSPGLGRGTRSKIARVENETIEVKSPASKGRKTEASVIETAPVQIDRTRAKRGRSKASATVPEAVEVPIKTRRTRNNTEKRESVRSGSPKAKQTRGTKAKKNESKTVEDKPSPKKTRSARGRGRSPAPPARRTARRRDSLVITKKAPVMSPKPTTSIRNRSAIAEDTTKLETEKRSTRQRAEAPVEKVKSPKRTRAKLVVARPSPKLNPRSAVVESPEKSPAPTKRGRRNDPVDTPAPSPKKTRRAEKAQKSPEKPKPSPLKRGRSVGRRNTPVDTPAPSPKKTRRNDKAQKSPEKPKPSPPKRGRTAVNKSQDVEPPAKRGRTAAKNVTQKSASPKKTRGKDVSQETIAAPTRSNRRTKAEPEPVAPQTNKRKRKANEEQSPLPAKVAKYPQKWLSTRSRKAGTESFVISVSPKGNRTVSPAKQKTTRGIQKESSTEVLRSTRQRRTKAEASPAKKGKESPVRKAAVATAKKTKASPAKKIIASPAKKIKASPAKKASPKKTSSAKKSKVSPAKQTKASPAKKASPVKKAKASPVKKAKVSPAKKTIASPVKKAKASPVKKPKASPIKKAKTSPAKKASPIKKAKASAVKKTKASPVKKTKASPVKKSKVSPVKKVKESPTKKTRGEKKVPAAAASPAKGVKNTRSRRR